MSVIAPLNPVERAAATQQTRDKFVGRPLDFSAGVTCIHALREHMRAFGYSPPAIPAFHDIKGAKRALRKMGHQTLKGLLDEFLTPIPRAQMRIGDVILGPNHPFEAVGINVGGGKFLGWLEDGRQGLVNIVPEQDALIGAWRLI